MNDMQDIFQGIQSTMWDAAMAIVLVLGLYLALPAIAIIALLKLGFRLRGLYFQVTASFCLVGCVFYFAYVGLPKLSQIIH